MIMIIILSYIFWILYSFMEGIREANLRQNAPKSEVKLKMYNLQRIGVLLMVSILLYFKIKFLAILVFASMLLTFPYIHNGTYFSTRNRLSPLEGFCKDSKDEKLSIHFNYKIRSRLIIIGIGLIILSCFI